ncbi:MAG TPA: hypothetical protein VMY78_05975 [Solirubrobacteraceae bacterium]|nr:hypothetical protein [Solirubrobacteraceae bacterium]
MDSAVVAAVIGPVVTALASALAWWLREAHRRRDHGAAVEGAHARIAMIENWLRAYREVATPEEYEAARRDAREQLLEARALIDEVADTAPPDRDRSGWQELVVRLALRDAMTTRSTRIVGVLYYVSLAWLLLVVTTGSLLAASAGASSDSVLGAAGYGLAIFAMSIAVGLAPVLPLYAWLSSAGRAGTDAR